MNIGEVAAESGVPAKTIRYYEAVGLIVAAPRAENRYRRYGAVDLHTLRFIRQARGLGFSVAEVRALLALWRDRSRASAEVRAIAIDRIGAIDRKIVELSALRHALIDLSERCQGDGRPDCPILDALAAPALPRPEDA